MIMTKESHEAWMKMQHFVYEINLCLQEQYPWEETKENELVGRLEIFDKIINKLCSESINKASLGGKDGKM